MKYEIEFLKYCEELSEEEGKTEEFRELYAKYRKEHDILETCRIVMRELGFTLYYSKKENEK